MIKKIVCIFINNHKIIINCSPTSNSQASQWQIIDHHGENFNLVHLQLSACAHYVCFLFWIGVFCRYKMAVTVDESLRCIPNQRLEASLHFSPEDFLPKWSVLVVKLCLSISSQRHILSLSLFLSHARSNYPLSPKLLLFPLVWSSINAPFHICYTQTPHGLHPMTNTRPHTHTHARTRTRAVSHFVCSNSFLVSLCGYSCIFLFVFTLTLVCNLKYI